MEGLKERTNLSIIGVQKTQREKAIELLEYAKKVEHLYNHTSEHDTQAKTQTLKRGKLKKGRGFALKQLEREYKEIKKNKVA